jgi:hypothetical protein
MANPLSIFAGPSPLPSQYGTITGQIAPTQFNQGGALFTTGAGLQSMGQQELAVAAAGQLTAPQQAALSQYHTGLENTALQTYENMGLTPSRTTSYISTEADIDQKTLAMAQQFIQSTIALGGAALAAGASFFGLGEQAESAAANELNQAGAAQLQNDKAYSDLIGSVFGSIAKIFSFGIKP